jgi:hypothetical protein
MPHGMSGKTPGADAARDKIQGVLKATYGPVFHAGKDYAAAHGEATAHTDIVQVMGDTVQLILAAEHLAEVATEAAKAARSMLGEQMAETGCFRIASGDTNGAHLSRKPAYVSIDGDPPPEYMMTPVPVPVPRTKEIKQILENGGEVPNCTLIRPNGYTLVVTTKKAK